MNIFKFKIGDRVKIKPVSDLIKLNTSYDLLKYSGKTGKITKIYDNQNAPVYFIRSISKTGWFISELIPDDTNFIKLAYYVS